MMEKRWTMGDIMRAPNVADWFREIHSDNLEIQHRFYAFTEEGPRGIFFITSNKAIEIMKDEQHFNGERRFTVRLYEPDAEPNQQNCFAVGGVQAFSSFKKALKAVHIFKKVEMALCEKGVPKNCLWQTVYPTEEEVEAATLSMSTPSALQIEPLEVVPERCIRDICKNPPDGVDGKCHECSVDDYEGESFIDDGFDDEQAFASAGFGTDESYE